MGTDYTLLERLWFGDLDDDDGREKAAQSAAGLTGAFEGLKPFPAAARRLIACLGREDADAAKVERIIESDPGLAINVLKVVNSAAFGLRSSCNSVGHAAVLLGFSAIGDMATSLAVSAAVDDGSPVVTTMLEHMRLVAAVAQRIGASNQTLRRLPTFTVGLLHDIGKLMQIQVGTADYLDVIGDDPANHYIKEREAMGYDHALLGAYLLESWGLPEPIPQAVGWHHQPVRAYANPNDDASRLVAVTRLADRFVHAYTDGAWPDDDTLDAIAQDEAASFLGFDAADTSELLIDIPQILIHERSAREAA